MIMWKIESGKCKYVFSTSVWVFSVLSIVYFVVMGKDGKEVFVV